MQMFKGKNKCFSLVQYLKLPALVFSCLIIQEKAYTLFYLTFKLEKVLLSYSDSSSRKFWQRRQDISQYRND